MSSINVDEKYTSGFDDEFSNIDAEDTELNTEEPVTDTNQEPQSSEPKDSLEDTQENSITQSINNKPEAEDFIEPSIEEQIKEQDNLAEKKAIVKQVKNEIFDRTGLKVADNDPMLQLILILKDITENQLEVIFNNIEANTDNLTDNLLHQLEKVGKTIADKQAEAGETIANQQSVANKAITKSIQGIDTAFEAKITELQSLLDKLEDQKEQIVTDVWGKLEQRVTDKIQNELTSDIKAIAENSNNTINNERMLLKGMLRGGMIGGVVGVILCAIILIIIL